MKLRSSIVSSVMAACVLATGGGAQAQEDGLAARLFAGDCSEPGEIVAALSNVSATTTIDETAPAGLRSAVGTLGEAVAVSTTSVPLTLGDIAASDHALAVSSGPDPARARLLCGQLGRFELDGSDVQFGLAATSDAGLGGIAWLRDNADGTTTVFLALARDPASVPADPGSEVAVSILRSAYEPNPLEIPAGTTVTWTNHDALPHTITSTDGVLDSGYMPKAATFTYTFETPGTFPIICVYHPRMRATVVVE